MPKREITTQKRVFRGYQGPNYTMVPDELFDEQLSELSGAELKVLLYIIRRTFGFKRDSDNISLAQLLTGITTRDGRVLDRGTGLSKKTLLEALRSLEERNLIQTERRQSAERGNEPTSYRLNVVGAPPGVETTPPLVEKLHQGGGGETPPSPRGKNYTTQETVEQKTVQQDDDDIREALKRFGVSTGQAQRLAATYPVALILEKLDQVSYLVERRSPLISRNPQGFLVKAIEENYLPEKPQGYKTKAEREAQAQQRQEHEAELERARLDRERTILAYKQQQQPKPIPGTKLTTATSWEQTLATLQGQMTTANFNMWLKQTVLVDCRDGQALIAAPSTFVAEWLQTRMVPIVKRALVDTLGQPIELQFTVALEVTPPADA